MAEVCIFLSCVSAEFKSYREVLRRYLSRPNISVRVQEDFIAPGGETLEMLDDYIRCCKVVIHLVGDLTGAMAQGPSVAAIRARYPELGERLPVAEFAEEGGPALSYTQWEAWLALFHGARLIIATPGEGAARDGGPQTALAAQMEQRAQQQAHLARLAQVERYPGIRFHSADQLAAEVWRSGLLDILIEKGLVRQIVQLPYKSLEALFKGRDALLDDLLQRFGPVPQGHEQLAVVVVLTGMGGIGKTRLALEYAWRQSGAYPVRLLIGADGPEALNRNLAALCAKAILDLPEQAETDEGRQRDAVLRWLNQHAGWLLILDNIDTEAAARAVEGLLPRLSGGHVLLTSRQPNWSAGIQAVPVGLLSPDAAVDFLLSRTQGRRRPQPDDLGAAARLAEALGYLALGLEQAGAYIAQRRSTFGQYLAQWERSRTEVLQWSDERLMQYPRSVAITWHTSFAQLQPPARRLLQRLAWLAAEPIPETLLDVALPEPDALVADPHGALAELEAYSLVMRAIDVPFFEVHRLVQEVTRQGLQEDAGHAVLVEALTWVNAAFVGDSGDVRSWPVLDPLVAHALAVAEQADLAGICAPTARLFNQVGVLSLAKAIYAEAEPSMRRALAIDEACFGVCHPEVAVDLNNLAQLLKSTNRSAEAEPLMRRALAIDEASFGSAHPNVGRNLNNLAGLLLATNRLTEAEPLMRRALAIDEVCFGAEHPDVATDLNNLAALLQATNRLTEAEPLMRRALAIDEACFGVSHPRVATKLNNLAQLLTSTNRLAEAEPLMLRALTIDEVSFGADHPRVAIDLNNLAQLLHHTSRVTEAEPLMRRAMTIDEASFGTEHPNVAIRLNNLAQLLQATNRLNEAEPMMRRALEIDEVSFGAEHPDVGRDLNNLASLLLARNQMNEAEPLMRRALEIHLRSLGLNHPKSRMVGSNYIELLTALGRSENEIKAELASLRAAGA